METGKDIYFTDDADYSEPLGNYDVCDSCGGDGGFDDTYIGPDHVVTSDWHECRACSGSGHVFHE